MTSPSATSLTVTLARVDLNLLLALDALLRERSVTRAAQTLGLGQPALSSSLAKLRRYFRDDLLVRVGNAYELTPLAASLAERTADAMAANGRVFGTQDSFDPAASDREFLLYLSDYAISVLSAPLSRLTREQAPGVRIRILQHTYAMIENAAEILRENDGIVLPHGFISEARSMNLFTDRFVCLVSTENDAVGEVLTLEELGSMPMVVPFHSSRASAAAVMQLRLAGVEPLVDTVTESFLSVPFLVAGTDRIGFVPALLAARIAPLGETRIIELPFPTADIVEALWWNPLYDNDPGHRWLRGALRQAAANVRQSQQRSAAN